MDTYNNNLQIEVLRSQIKELVFKEQDVMLEMELADYPMDNNSKIGKLEQQIHDIKSKIAALNLKYE